MPRKPKYGYTGDIVEVSCVDCGAEFLWTIGNGGRPRQRCDNCWARNEQEVDTSYARRWRKRHPERMREINRKSYRKRGGYEAIRRKEARDPSYKRSRRRISRRYHNSDKGRHAMRMARLRRRRCEHEQGGRMINFEEWQLTLNAFGNRCAYCGKKADPITQDHFVPVTAGGLTVLGNIVPACASCNSSKYNHLPEEFLSPKKYRWIVKVLSELSQE